MKSITFQFYITIAVALAGCKKIEPPVTETNTDEQEVILRLMMPQNNKLSTYAIDSVDQNTIYTLDVLAFRIADDGKEIYAYRKRGILLRPNPGATEVNFYANLLKSDDNYRFVLIANAATQLQEVLNKLAPNTLKETLMSSLTYTITNRWNNNSSTNFTPLPMWGESNIIHGINTNTQGFNVSMLRSLAAIDVSVSARNFIMTAVRVYNHPTKGRVAPLAANYDAVNRKVTKPSIPPDAGLLPKPDFYNTNSENAVKNEIFLFERDASATGESNATALLIKGKYNGSNTETYYRIDLTDDNGKPMPLLRNHRYSIDITTVHAPGFADETQAWNSRPVGMTASVTQWNEVTIADTNVPPQYYLKVSITQAEVNGLRGELIFDVSTNAPDITLNLPIWLNILGRNELGDKITYKLKIDENPSATKLRNGKINVIVGRITRVINIEQGGRPVDLGNDYNFYVFAKNISSTGSGIPAWYALANVENGLVSALDASLTQKPGEPYASSCVAKLGQGARLPTFAELEQLMPVGNSNRDIVNAALSANGADPMPYEYPQGGVVPFYLSSSADSHGSLFRLIDYDGTRLAYAKNSNMGNYVARCVISKENQYNETP
ncbi:Uncharacterised protein [Sphingobacterium spiritivorum]|uniref:Major fimbrial subunit protein (FimA) n=1 Tax=Sphingobacterium spiritivorum TaxID=258 RepID=A0A380BSU6_SPHSI|nr:hypothetical protein [Sphingobacterium spiritivorum]SUJ06480.1 Uncharacterised protein [Sphingobacterium spiritivorum]